MTAWSLAPPAFNAVDVREASRAYGRVHALYRCSATFQSGTASVVLGPNGAGKTTLLSMLATLERPDSGSVSFQTENRAFNSTRDRHVIRPHIGLVAHDSLLYADLTGAENLAFTADMYGRPRTEVTLWLERVGLTDAADRIVSTYSRGMRQRLSIARALLPEPTLVLFDEPLTGLDRTARGFLYDTIAKLRAARRIVIVVTHHLDWPHAQFDRALVLDGGRARFDGPSDTPLATRYAREVQA